MRKVYSNVLGRVKFLDNAVFWSFSGVTFYDAELRYQQMVVLWDPSWVMDYDDRTYSLAIALA